MATVTMQGTFTDEALDRAWAKARSSMSAEVRRGWRAERHRYITGPMMPEIEVTLEDIKLVRIDVVDDETSPWHRCTRVIIDPEDESWARVWQALPNGMELTLDGWLRDERVQAIETTGSYWRYRAVTGHDPGNDHVPTQWAKLEVTAYIDGEDQGVSLDIHGDHFAYGSGRIQLKTKLSDGREDSFTLGLPDSWQATNVPADYDTADYLRRYGDINGYNIGYIQMRDSPSRALTTTGSSGGVALAMSVPSDDRMPADQVKGRKLLLDVDNAPQFLDAPGSAMVSAGHSWLIALGVSRSHEYFKTWKSADHAKTYPAAMRGNRSQRFWNMPVDRFVFQKSQIGWHGLFLLAATAKANGHISHTGHAHIVYCVPVFLAFAECSRRQYTHRRLSPELQAFVSGSYGLSDFLQQALFTLQGAKARMAKAGIDLNGFELKAHAKAPALPKGHAIRSLGTNTSAVYEVVGRKFEPTRAYSLGWSCFSTYAKHHVREQPNEAEDQEMGLLSVLQPATVATRRVLEV